MSKRAWVVLGLLWAFSLALVAAVSAGQTPLYRPLREPKVMSGGDVGFRVDGMYGEQPAGTVVVRVNGRWVDVALSPGVRGRDATQ